MSGIIMYQALEEQKADDLERMKLELLRKDGKLIQIENQMQEFMLMALDIMKVRESIIEYLANPKNKKSDAEVEQWIHSMLP
jgi:hypothetical protein